MSWRAQPPAEARQSWVGAFEFSEALETVLTQRREADAFEIVTDVGESPATRVKGLFGSSELDELARELDAQDWVPVGVDGILSHYQPGDQIGSFRATAYQPEVADELYRRVSPALREWEDERGVWTPVGVSPLFRFIRYRDGGVLVPHYDAPFDFSERESTRMSLIAYLEHSGEGGETRFLWDPQDSVELSQRDFSDWDRFAEPCDVRRVVDPSAGDGLVFEHRSLHDSAPLRGSKTLLRTDVVYALGDASRS